MYRHLLLPRFDRFIRCVAEMRFLTFSLLLHLALLLLVGSAVWVRLPQEPSNFLSGDGGGPMVAEEIPIAPITPPETLALAPPPAPHLPALVPVNVLVHVSHAPNWKLPVPIPPVRGRADSTENLFASLRVNLPAPATSFTITQSSGSRSATIFGQRITAHRLGVILDVSGSAQPHLAGAVTEIQAWFADAILILYPGCGLTKPEGRSSHLIRRFSSLTARELDATRYDYDTTASQLVDALLIPGFEAMTRRPSLRETLFVSWYAGEGTGPASKPEASYDKLIGQTQVAFEELLRRNVDTIYWFSDFEDPVDPRLTDALTTQMKLRRVKLHLHNFASTRTNESVLEMARKTGGSSNTEAGD